MNIYPDLDKNNASLVVIDIQQKLAAAISSEDLHALLRKVINLVECARLLDLPVIVTEQYPQGLGRTLPMIGEAVYRCSPDIQFVPKKRFSCAGVPEFDGWLRDHGRRQLIITGIETHVCVFATARDLARQGYSVHVPRDAVTSRSESNHSNGLSLIERAGGIVTNSETVIFDLLKVAEGDAFKAMSKLIKQTV